MPPIAVTVAGDEPERAAKNMDATTVTIPTLPVTHPTTASAKSRILRDMPPDFIRLPASIKNGIAIRGKESSPLRQAVDMVVRLIFVVAVMEPW